MYVLKVFSCGSCEKPPYLIYLYADDDLWNIVSAHLITVSWSVLSCVFRNFQIASHRAFIFQKNRKRWKRLYRSKMAVYNYIALFAASLKLLGSVKMSNRVWWQHINDFVGRLWRCSSDYLRYIRTHSWNQSWYCCCFQLDLSSLILRSNFHFFLDK